jgi:hypothetical protein
VAGFIVIAVIRRARLVPPPRRMRINPVGVARLPSRDRIVRSAVPYLVLAGGCVLIVIDRGAAPVITPAIVLAYCVWWLIEAGRYRSHARRDPIGFASIGVTALGFTAAGVGAELLGARVAVSSALFIAAVVSLWLGANTRAWDAWRHYVLRRPRLTTGEIFDREMIRRLNDACEVLGEALHARPEQQVRATDRVQVMMDRLRMLAAPDDSWAAARDAQVRAVEVLVAAMRRHAPAEEWNQAIEDQRRAQTLTVALRTGQPDDGPDA